MLVVGSVDCPSCYGWSETGQTGEDEFAEVAESVQVVNPCEKEKLGSVAAACLEVFVCRVTLMNL